MKIPLIGGGRLCLERSGIRVERKGGSLPMNGYSGGGRRGGARSWFYGLLPGAKIDYQRVAGDLWRNSIVSTVIGWIGRNLPQARPCVFRSGEDNTDIADFTHPIVRLLNRPNRFYDGIVLRYATCLSLITGGNAYWYIVTDNLGKPKELWFLPHFQVTPIWRDDATTDNWIEGYEYRQNGESIILKFEDVIHFRQGLDPNNPRLGLADLAAAFREVCTQNEVAGYEASLMHNLGIPGVIISPTEGTEFGPGQDEEIEAMVEEKTAGDNRGKPLVLTAGIKVDKLTLSPEELLLATMPDRSEAVICALIGINPVVLGLPSGLKASTYNNQEEAIKSAWENGILPRLNIIDETLDVQLLPYFEPYNRKGLRCGHDFSKVRALRDSEDSLYTRLGTAVGGPWMSVNEARAKTGLKKISDPVYDKPYPPAAKQKPADPQNPGDLKNPDDNTDDPNPDANNDNSEE